MIEVKKHTPYRSCFCLRDRRVFYDSDERKIAIPARRIEAVADHEPVWDDEAGVIDDQFFLDTRLRLIKECIDLDRGGAA